MNSQQTRTPFFEYFYDPPSPDVPSEYDPPFPSELGTPHSKASFDFSSRELYGDSFMNEGAKDDDIECQVSKEEEESLGMKLAALNGEDGFFHESNLAESNGNFPESKHLDANFKLTNLRQFSSNGTTISGQVKDHLLIDQNDEEKEDICTKQSESSEMHESVITKELFTTEFPSDGHLAETSQTDRNLHKYNDVNNHIPIPCDESSSCGDAQRGKRNHISPHSGSGLTEDAESSPPNSQKFIQKCSDANILRADVPHSQNSEEINNFSSGLLYEELHSTLKEESCSNTQPTNQSGSFTSNTEVKKMSNEPPLPLENTIPLDINTRSSVPSDTFSETAHFIQHSMRDRRAFPSCSDYDGDSLRSPSPTFSSFLTESCSITPFPADCASPYSTNPTSTPLPSPIPSEMLSNLTSESSPSTPSTITSSAMLCVSRKLEGLANGASVASSNSSSKEENYDKNEFNLDFENNQLRKELNENLSPPNFRDTLISKNDKSPDNSNKLELTGDKRVSENSRASSFVNPNYHQSSFTSKGNMSSIKACEIPDHSGKMATLLNEPKQVIKPTKIPRSQAYDAHSLAQKANSNIIYCYSPIMEKANVAELKEKFMGPESTKMGKKVLKSKQISECRSGIPVHQSKDTKKQVSQDSMEETESNTDNNPPKIQTNEPSSTKPKSPKILSPPQPPPRLAPSFKDVPPPIPPPPAEDEDENDLPPIPKLPQKNKYLSNRALLSSPPVPPVRQYLLIPIIPGKATPILLTPPPTPKRSSSFFETSPPSRSSRPLPPTLSHPPPAPPPRQFSPVARKVHQDQYEDEERTMNGFFAANDLVPPKNGACTRYLPLGRELTPVPEEKASSASSSSSPEANDLYFLFHSSPLRDNEDLGKSPLENEERNQSCLLKPSFPPPPPPLPPSTPTDNHTFTDKSSSHSPVPSTERTPPPPLPPRQKTFKITPSLKPPPPPPPPPPLSPPPPPKRMIGPLSGTCVSSTASSPSIVLPGLSPCRAIDRSPPNDRDFPIFSADADTTEEPKQPPRKPSSPALIIGASDQPTLPGPPPPPPPVAPPPIPPGMDSSPGGIKSGCMSVSSYGRLVIDRSDLPLPLPDEEIRKVYAAVKRWGWISSYRDTLAIYTQFRPIIQKGPQCGLVALSMASHVCQKSVPVQELLEKARAKEISCHGEMFSARAMADLATEMLKGVSASVREGVLESPSEVVKILLEGDFILFPYDSEPNHFPGFHKGMKAHWGLLCGCIVQSSGLEILRKHDFSIIKSDPQVDLLWHLRPLTKSLEEDHRPSSVPLSRAPEEVTQRGSRSVSPYSLSEDKASTKLAKEKHPVRTMLSSEFGKKEWCKNDNISNLVVLYRQGKSRNLIYTPLEDLSFSNRQLLEYPPNEGYIIGSVEVGLSKQVVVLHKEKPGLSDFLGLIQEKEANQ